MEAVRTIALVCGPNCELETQAVRSAFEYFGARIVTYWIGRPKELIALLSGEDLFPGTDLIILNFHGDEGAFLMPELGEDVYEEGEPKGNFGAAEILRYSQLAGRSVIANGCTLGAPELAQAFLDRGCSAYIGPVDYPEGSDALMFLIRLGYEYLQHGQDLPAAFDIARTMHKELTMYKLYEAPVIEGTKD